MVTSKLPTYLIGFSTNFPIKLRHYSIIILLRTVLLCFYFLIFCFNLILNISLYEEYTVDWVTRFTVLRVPGSRVQQCFSL